MSATEQTMFQRLNSAVFSGLVPIGVEILRLLPDSVVLGIALLATLSMTKSYGVLLFTMLELMISQRAFAMLIGGIAPLGAGNNPLQRICQPGFMFPNQMRITLLETIGTPSLFPSPTMFFLSGFVAYMVGAMQQFAREIKSLGGEIETRTNTALILSFLFIMAMMMFRYNYGCESFGSLLVSLILGAVMGMALVFQNQALFGRDSINVLNLPIIQSSLEKGRPMYVCGPSDI
jgi:hypothetical protein